MMKERETAERASFSDGKKLAKFGILANFLTKFALFDERKMAFLAAKSFGAYL